MRGLKVRKEEGENIRRMLVEKDFLVHGYKIKRHGAYLIFPVTERVEGEIVEASFEKLEERERITGTFDVIGDIAIVENDDRSILKRKNIRSVYKKETEVHGTYRTRRYRHLAGEKNTETIHKEYGCRYLLDITKVYFNPRLATERQRIAELVADGEHVIDMFAGVGPFSILIAKTHDVLVHSIDINPDAVHYLKKNIELNKVQNVIPHCGDCREVVKTVPPAERIIMNLPKDSLDFLDTAMSTIRKGGMIHLYSLQPREAVSFDVERIQKVKSYAPGTYVWRYDIRR
jgi:tRNA (guanine37-N1)-methyltransferase